MPSRPSPLPRRQFLAFAPLALTGLAVALASPALAQSPEPKKIWVCPPCGCTADGQEFDKPGVCPACGYTLVEKKPANAPSPTPSSSTPPSPTPPSSSAAPAEASPGADQKHAAAAAAPGVEGLSSAAILGR